MAPLSPFPHRQAGPVPRSASWAPQLRPLAGCASAGRGSDCQGGRARQAGVRLPVARHAAWVPHRVRRVWAWEGVAALATSFLCALRISLAVEPCSPFNSISKKSKSLNNLHPERKGSWLQVKIDGHAQRHGSLPGSLLRLLLKIAAVPCRGHLTCRQAAPGDYRRRCRCPQRPRPLRVRPRLVEA